MMPSVSGTLIRGLLEAADELLGKDVVKRGIFAVEPEIHSLVVGALPGQWVPITSAEATFRGIAEAANRDWPTLHRVLLTVLACGALACSKSSDGVGGAAIVGSGGSAAGGSSSIGGSSSGGSSSGGSSGVGGAACSQTQEYVSFALTDWQPCNGAGFDASAGMTLTLVGRVASVGSRSMNIETCSGCDACSWTTRTLTIDSASLPGLDAVFTSGAFVRLQAEANYFFGCHMALTLWNEPSLCGTPNPVASDERLYLSLADGELSSPGSPFTTTPVPLDCFPNAGPNCGGTSYALDSCALDFTAPGAATMRVAMGQTGTLDFDGGIVWTVRNLRSFQTANCDDYWNWAFWSVRTK